MTAQLAAVPAARVCVMDDVVHIRDLRSTDADLVGLLADATEPAELTIQALAIGARALRVSRVSIDTAMIEKSFAALTVQLATMLNDATSQVAGTTNSVLTDPESGVHASLNNWKRDVTEALAAIFDPDRATSAIGKLDTVMQVATDRQLAATRHLLNAENEDSPLFRLFSGVQAQIGLVLESVARVAEQVAADKASVAATALALERSAVKGIAFEERVAEVVTGLASTWGDVADGVGRSSGATGGRVGDVVVEVGSAGRYVLECKDRRLTLKATLAELRRAAANREAGAAIAVFARDEQCPFPAPFAVFDDLAVVVYDKDSGDPAALRLACAWARWIVQRDAVVPDVGIDSVLIHGLITDARRALERVANIRRAHSAAARKIEEAAGQVSELHVQVVEALDKVDQALAS